jgi:hypothetical protein
MSCRTYVRRPVTLVAINQLREIGYVAALHLQVKWPVLDILRDRLIEARVVEDRQTAEAALSREWTWHISAPKCRTHWKAHL